MKLILLPGMDGTGILFQPFLDVLPKEIQTQVITYPSNEKLSYQELVSYVNDKLPKDSDFVILSYKKVAFL